MLKFVILLAVCVVISNALVCPPGFCDKVDCEDLTECRASNGQKIRKNGSYCSCCDICIKLLGEGERCVPENFLIGVIIASECAEGLVCDENRHKCVRA